MIGGLVIEIEIEIGHDSLAVRASHSLAGVVGNENENEIDDWSGIDDCF